MSIFPFLGALLVLACGCNPDGTPDWHWTEKHKLNWDANWNWKWPRNDTPQPAIDAWPVNEMEKLSSLTPRRQDDLLVNPQTGAIDLFAASNETVSFQVVVQADARELKNVKVACAELQAGKKKITAENFRIYRLLPMRIAEYPAWYLRLTDAPPQPADFYDAMVPAESPVGGQPFHVEPAGRLVLWVDLYVPQGTAADEYAGEVVLSADDHQTWSAKMRVQVYDLVLPDARAIAAVGGFDHTALLGRLIQLDGKPFVPAFLDRRDPAVRRGLLAMRQLMQVGHNHRLDLFDTALRPLLKREPGGEVRLDWSDYDAIALPYLDGSAFADRVGCPAWPSPFCQNWPDPAEYGGAGNPAYVETAKAVLALCRNHFPEEDIRNRIFLWPFRSAGGQGESARAVWAESPRSAGNPYDDFARLARMIRSVDDRTPILCDLPAQAPPAAGWQVPTDFGKLVDILAPPGHWFRPRASFADVAPNGPSAATRAAGPYGVAGSGATAGAGAWLAPGFPPQFPSMGVLASPADVRAVPWLALKYGCPGLLVPDVLDWSATPFQQASPQGQAAGAGLLQTTLFYPGTIAGIEGVLPSVRLKWLRRGLQDIAYLSILRQRGHAEIARKLIDALVRYAGAEADADQPLDARLDGWVKDPQAWIAVRRLLADETQQVVNPSELTGQQLMAQRLAWQDLRLKTATLRIEQVRTKISTVQNAGGRQSLLATLMLDLYNEYDQPVSPVLQVGALPSGWESLDGGELRAQPLAPNTRGTVILSFQGLDMPPSTAAKMDIPLTFRLPGDAQKKLTVAVPALLAAPAAKPPVIDGHLGDWPLRAGNCAGDFVLLGRRGHADGGLAQRQTQAFVLCDRENLYIALRCQEPNMAELVMRPDNLVRYEQLMACGEDLVEVLLDPGAGAKGTEDLYHLLVKPSGIVIAERGVGTALPMGKSSPWASGAKVAVSRGAREWTVEMAIPLASFGPAASQQRFWGVNFSRFATRGAESSNWAGAARYIYHPRNLGTMYLYLPEATATNTKETPNGK